MAKFNRVKNVRPNEIMEIVTDIILFSLLGVVIVLAMCL
jgi:hypothetical protein